MFDIYTALDSLEYPMVDLTEKELNLFIEAMGYLNVPNSCMPDVLVRGLGTHMTSYEYLNHPLYLIKEKLELAVDYNTPIAYHLSLNGASWVDCLIGNFEDEYLWLAAEYVWCKKIIEHNTERLFDI